MRLILRVYEPSNPEDVAVLFQARYYTIALTGDSNGFVAKAVEVEIDGSKELTQTQWKYLSRHRYTLSFSQPYPTYTEEEEKILDAY